MTNTKPTLDENMPFLSKFDKEFSNVGWLPENKLKVLRFIQKVHDEAYQEGYKKAVDELLINPSKMGGKIKSISVNYH